MKILSGPYSEAKIDLCPPCAINVNQDFAPLSEKTRIAFNNIFVSYSNYSLLHCKDIIHTDPEASFKHKRIESRKCVFITFFISSNRE